MRKKSFSELSGNAVLQQKEMLTLKGGYLQAYGCDSNVCKTDRSGAKGLCTDAYCKSGVGPAHPSTSIDKCIMFTNL